METTSTGLPMMKLTWQNCRRLQRQKWHFESVDRRLYKEITKSTASSQLRRSRVYTDQTLPPVVYGNIAEASAECDERDIESTIGPTPPFLANKLTIEPLSIRNVYDYQLREHFITTTNLYTLTCACLNHKHNKQPCSVVTTQMCPKPKCGAPTQLLIEYQSLLMHPQLDAYQLMRCCRHTHAPPCQRCINCQIIRPDNSAPECIIKTEFTCDATTNVVCRHGSKDVFTRTDIRPESMLLHEHVYNARHPEFYFCFTHSHYHRSRPEVMCVISATECCENAISVRKVTESFIIYASVPVVRGKRTIKAAATPNSTPAKRRRTVCSNDSTSSAVAGGNDGRQSTGGAESTGAATTSFVTRSFIIFNPAIWREQAANHFMSFVRACIMTPHAITDRYKRFEKSNYHVPLKPYISGKDSFVRSSVTGFNADGVYQTSTISCLLPPDVVVLPQNLYSLLEPDFDLSLVMLKRDPSLGPTCMYVLRVERNPDPQVNVIVISDQISKGLNQDQDGDRNAIYLLRKHDKGFDATRTYRFAVTQMERAFAFLSRRTLLAWPRFRLSETSVLKLWRHGKDFAHLKQFARIRHMPASFIDDAFAGYFSGPEYDEFQAALRAHNRNEKPSMVTAADLLLQTDRFASIVQSGAKGNMNMIELLVRGIESSNVTLDQLKPEMLNLINQYLTSSQDLSHAGRILFILIFAGHDLRMLFYELYLKNELMASFHHCAVAFMVLLYSEATLQLATSDLVRSAVKQNLFTPEQAQDLLDGLVDVDPA